MVYNGLTDHNYSYDKLGHLISIDSLGTNIASYAYDGDWRRIKKDETGSYYDRYFTFDYDGNLTGEYDLTNASWKSDYVYLNGLPLAKLAKHYDVTPPKSMSALEDIIEPPDPPPFPLIDSFFIHTDHLGTPLAFTNEHKYVRWRAEYYPFGSLNQEIVTTNKNYLRFPGQWEDERTGLYYNWHRYYSPQLGRFITPDPIGLSGGINLYSYTANNPINYIDPDGQFVITGTILGIWGLVELGMSVWDAIETIESLLDPCTSWGEKGMVVGAFAARVAHHSLVENPIKDPEI